MNYRIESIKTIGDLKPGQKFTIDGKLFEKMNNNSCYEYLKPSYKWKHVILNPSTKIDCLVKE